MQKLTSLRRLGGINLMAMGLVGLLFLCGTSLRAQTNFSSPEILTGDWGSVTNDNSGVMPDPGNPGIAGIYPNAPLWYQWTAPVDGEVELDTIGSFGVVTNYSYTFIPTFTLVTNVMVAKLDTVLGVYTGTSVAQLSQVAANDDLFPVLQQNYTAQNIFSLDSSNAPVPVQTTYGFRAIGPVETYYYQPYNGPSGLRFNAKIGVTYYFAVDTKLNDGPVVLNWAYHPAGVFRLASENIDQTGIKDTNGNPMLLYQTAETETSRRWYGTVNAAFYETTLHTYYTYNVPGRLVTITRSAGSSGRMTVDYTTVDGDTNMLTDGDAPALAGLDYIPVSGTLTFNDFEMSKTILIPILDDYGLPQKNRDFTVVLSNPQRDPGESDDVSEPRLDPTYYQALVRILDVDVNPKGPSAQKVVDTNTVPSTTNYVYSLEPTNGVFNFQKVNYRVPRDVDSYWGGTPITVYVTRNGTNRASETVHWSVNSYLLDKGDINGNIYFPLQPGSDYATPDPAHTGGVFGLIPDFKFSTYNGTITFPGGNNIDPQPIQFTVYDNAASQFNEDFHINLYGLDSNGGVYQEGMVAETTVTILFDDQHPPAGSVDENYNPDYGLNMAPPINTTPQQISHPGTDPYGNGPVYGLTILPNNETMIVGDFSSYNGAGRKGMALIKTNGALDTALNPGSGPNDFINAVAVNSVGQYVIGGGFTSFNGTQRDRIARINANGSLDTTFDTRVGADGTVWAVAMQPDGKVLVGGDFTHINGTPCQYIARLNPNGMVDTNFICTNIVGSVYALALQGNQVVVGGDFTVTNLVYANIARLNADGSLDTLFNPGVGADDTVFALAAQPNGQIVVGGGFTHMNGASYNSLVRLNGDGSIDTTNFFVGSGADDLVYSIALQTNGTIYIGGSFSTFNGTHRLGFARLYSDGTVDTSFMDTAYNQFAGLPKAYFNDEPGAVYTAGIQSDGNVMIGGSFDQVGGGEFDPTIGSNSVPQNYDPNVWPEPKTRDGIRNRSNVARLIGGSTPGPGNISLAPDTDAGYSANKSQQYKYISLVRTNGALGPLAANFSVQPGLAKSGQDYVYNAVDPLYWISWEYVGPSRMHSDGLFGVNGYVNDLFGNFWSGGVVNLSEVVVSLVNNKANAGDLNAAFQLANPSLTDQFYLGGETIPLGGALGRSVTPFTLIDDNVQAGTFGFVADTFVATNLTANISVVRSNGVAGKVTMRYSTSDGTAVAGTDYTSINNQTLTFQPGVVANNFNVVIKNNGFIYTNPIEKTVILHLSTLNGPAGGNAVFGISNAVLRLINPNYQGYLTFSATNYTGAQSSGSIKFIVNRTSGSKGSLSVQYATANGSAVAGVDYTGATNTLQWGDGDVSPRLVSIPLVNYQTVGTNKQFFVSLSNPKLNGVLTPALMGLITNCTLTILNDNSFGSLKFSQPNYTVNENGGYATITVIRTGGAAGSVSVNFATADSSATGGVNYAATNGVLTFAPNQLAASFDVPILNDSVQDPSPANFYFVVSLSNPTNATLGSPSTSMVHIVDAQSYNRPPGTPDTAFDPNAGMNGDVLALALQSNGEILAGGGFTTVGTTPENHLARLNTDGSLDGTFLNGLSGPNGSVQAIANQTDDRVLVGGSFTFVDGIARNSIARLMPDGSVDTSFNPGAGADNAVYALAETFVGGLRKIYVGGAFGSVNSVTSHDIVRMNQNGTVDSSFVTGNGADGAVYAIAVYPTNSIFAGKVLIGGAFTHYNGTNLNYIARLNADGSVDGTFNAGLGANDVVRAITIQQDGRILVGGSFTTFNGAVLRHIARLNADGSLDNGFTLKVGSGVNSAVEAIALEPDNRIVVVGQFSQNNGVPRSHITRLLSSGEVDSTINFGTGANGDIYAALVQPADGMIVIGGAFTLFNEQSHDHIARIYGGSTVGGSVVIPAGSALVQESFSPANGIIDPKEYVSLEFAFRASAGANVSNLVATLLATNGIVSPTPASQSYGPLTVSGPSASRLFAFNVNPSYTNGQLITATFDLTEGTNDLGTASFTYALGISTNTFANTNIIYISDNTNASPYPSTINVGGLVGSIIKATVTFTNLTHSWPADIDALLESPVQKSSLLMANAGNGYALHGVTLKFDDAAAAYLPQSAQIVSGTNKPTAYLPVANFPMPAPSGPYATNLANFNGSNPDGLWSLFVIDDSPLNSGAITNGWFLNLITANLVGTAADVALRMTASPVVAVVSNNLQFILTVTNYGPSAATGVIVTNTLPSAATFVSAAGTLGSALQNGSQVVWNIGSLAINAGAKLTITVKPGAFGVINDSAHVTSTSSDPNPDDDSASVTLNVSDASAPMLSGSLSGNNGQFQFMLTGTPGESYIIQASTNLVNWISIYTNLSPFTFTDPNATNYPSRFYRALIGP